MRRPVARDRLTNLGKPRIPIPLKLDILQNPKRSSWVFHVIIWRVNESAAAFSMAGSGSWRWRHRRLIQLAADQVVVQIPGLLRRFAPRARGGHQEVGKGVPELQQSGQHHAGLVAKRGMQASQALKPTLDERNPAPPEKPWNDDSPGNTNKQWTPLVSKRCRISSIHSMCLRVSAGC